MPWVKGQSGNPSGSPPKSRALTAILERAGNKTLDYQGKPVARKRILAQLLWEAVTTGQAKLPNDVVLSVGVDDWFEVVKFLYQHIDGPPKGSMDLTSNGEPIRSDAELIAAIARILDTARARAAGSVDEAGGEAVDATGTPEPTATAR